MQNSFAALVSGLCVMVASNVVNCAAFAAPAVVATGTAAQGAATHNERLSPRDAILKAAMSCVDQEMWKPGYGLPNGKLGCAAALSNVLKKAGVKGVSSANVQVMRRQLLTKKKNTEMTIRSGGKEIDDKVLIANAQPGDVIVAFNQPPDRPNNGPNAHCGIMSGPTTICTNNWMDGHWINVDIHSMFDYFPYVRVIKMNSL